MNLRTLATVVLLLVLAGLAAAFGYLTRWGDAFGERLPPPRVAPGAAKEAALLPAYKLAFEEASTHKLMVERPLFTPTRAPAPPAAAPVAAAPTMQRGKYVLTGAIIAADVRAAYLREVAGNKSHSVKQGDTLPDGYRVELVEARRVVLRFNNDSEDVELQTSGTAPRPGAPIQQAIVQPLSPYTTTIDRPQGTPGVPPVPGIPGLPGVPGVAGVTPQPGIYPPGVFPPGAVPQGVATSTPGFPVPQPAVPAAVPPAAPAAPTTSAPADAANPPRRRMWQNAQ
jgi:hypothetical protein